MSNSLGSKLPRASISGQRNSSSPIFSLRSLQSRLSLSDEEYRQRWAAFMQADGSIKHGAPLTNEEIDELIGEEAMETHAANTERTDVR